MYTGLQTRSEIRIFHNMGFSFLPRIPRHELPVIVVTQGVFSFLGVTSGRLIPIDICVMRIISLKFGCLVGLFMVFNATFSFTEYMIIIICFNISTFPTVAKLCVVISSNPAYAWCARHNIM
jgi:hypothetical protein